ncbi:YetF domain-containing protein [Singulisphaera sp. Ch08]|uniref:YetF domain-containing protein n=1 Tax=Singulisphaera sp. Ch08 TaxID=3120278 RepID=A0AAU7CI32_9BACT
MSFHWFWSQDLWRNMWWLTGISLAEKVLRPVIVYAFLVIGLRVFGKRELVQLNPFDFVVLISLSNTVQNAIIGNDNSVAGGLIGALALLLANYLVVRFLFGHRRLDQLIQGEPTVLIENGSIVREALAKELVTESELMTILHRQSFTSLSEVNRCVLEPGGSISVEGKNPRQVDLHHHELMAKLNQLSRQIEELKDQVRQC